LRFHVPAERPELIAFATSPTLEAVLSLHVLTGPKHHALQHEWVRRARRLPVGLRRRIRAFSFAYHAMVPDFLLPSAHGDDLAFDDELAALRALDPEQAAFEFLRPLWDHEGVRDPAKLRDPDVRAHAERRAEQVGADPVLAALIFDDPAELARRFAALLADYWEAAFGREWTRLEPQLARTVVDAGRTMAREGVYALLGSLSRRLRVDLAREEVGIDIPHHHRVEPTHTNPLVLVPSVYGWPHVHVNCDEPSPFAIVYPAPFIASDARPQIPDAELLRLLRALGDDTRLRALRLIADRPRSTQELAPLVGITEAGLSKHLRTLADAGVLEARRDGYYVLYSLRPERVEPLSSALLTFLGRETS
jgi:DNA-binding transcriptional ArsR family regulator